MNSDTENFKGGKLSLGRGSGTGSFQRNITPLQRAIRSGIMFTLILFLLNFLFSKNKNGQMILLLIVSSLIGGIIFGIMMYFLFYLTTKTGNAINNVINSKLSSEQDQKPL